MWILLAGCLAAGASGCDDEPEPDPSYVVEWDTTQQRKSEGKYSESGSRIGWWKSAIFGEKESETLYGEDGRLVAKRIFETKKRPKPSWMVKGGPAMRYANVHKHMTKQAFSFGGWFIWAAGGLILAVILLLSRKALVRLALKVWSLRELAFRVVLTTFLCCLSGIASIALMQAIYEVMGREPAEFVSGVSAIAFGLGVVFAILPTRLSGRIGQLGAGMVAFSMFLGALILSLLA